MTKGSEILPPRDSGPCFLLEQAEREKVLQGAPRLERKNAKNKLISYFAAGDSLRSDTPNSGYAARYFSPVRMHLNLTLAILPDCLLCFAHDQNTDVFQIHQQFSDSGIPPYAMLNTHLQILWRSTLELPCIGRRQYPVFREFVRYCT